MDHGGDTATPIFVVGGYLYSFQMMIEEKWTMEVILIQILIRFAYICVQSVNSDVTFLS